MTVRRGEGPEPGARRFYAQARTGAFPRRLAASLVLGAVALFLLLWGIRLERVRQSERVAVESERLGIVFEEALLGDLEAVEARLREEPPENPLHEAAFLGALGRHYRGLAAPAEAEPLLRRALELRQDALPQGNLRVLAATVELGEVLLELERFQEAEPLFRQGVDRYRRTAGQPLALAAALEGVAAARQGQGDEEGALDLRLDALAGLRSVPEVGAPEGLNEGVARAHRALARSLGALGRHGAAEEELRRGIDLLTEAQAPQDLVGSLLCDLGRSLEARGELEEAQWKLAECRRLGDEPLVEETRASATEETSR